MEQQTECFNPATGERLGFSILHSENELREMVSWASSSQKAWEKTAVNERVKQVLKIRDFLIENADLLSETISRDNGKTRVEAIATEILPAAMAVSYYCKNAKRFLRDRGIRGGNIFLINKRSKIVRIP